MEGMGNERRTENGDRALNMLWLSASVSSIECVVNK